MTLSLLTRALLQTVVLMATCLHGLSARAFDETDSDRRHGATFEEHAAAHLRPSECGSLFFV